MDRVLNTPVCLKGPLGKYQDARGQTTCLECPLGKIANNKSTACARPDYIIASDCEPKLECLDDRDDDVYNHICMPCPVGGICDIPVALSELEPRPGFRAYSWAPSQAPFAKCPFEKACTIASSQPQQENANTTSMPSCAEGYISDETVAPLCGACQPNFALESTGCVSCEDGYVMAKIMVLLLF